MIPCRFDVWDAFLYAAIASSFHYPYELKFDDIPEINDFLEIGSGNCPVQEMVLKLYAFSCGLLFVKINC